MTLEDLRVFAAVCESGNLAAVARQLGRTQPAVSQHVRALEREFGQRLFHRQARGVVPTRAGRVLHHAVLEALGTIARAQRRMREAEANDPGPVRVVTGGTTVRHFLKDALMRFQMAHPHVELRFRTAHSTARCMELLVRDEADLAFVTAGIHAHHVDQVVLVEMPWYLICRAGDHLAASGAVNARDLANMAYVALPDESESHIQLRAALLALEVPLLPVAAADDWDTAIVLVETGLGKAIVPAVHALQLADGSAILARPIAGLPPVRFGWAARGWESLSSPCRTLVATWRREFGASPLVRTPGIRFVESMPLPQNQAD